MRGSGAAFRAQESHQKSSMGGPHAVLGGYALDGLNESMSVFEEIEKMSAEVEI